MIQLWLARFGTLAALIATAVLLASLSGWLWLSKRDAIRDCASTRESEIALAVEQGRTQAVQESLGRASVAATLAQQDNQALIADLSAIAARARETRTVYRDRVSTIPAATCAPGAERIDAVNALVRGEQ